ncbi:hypothetical protein BDR07DRAFT_369813 [Suillus spraguei]|nr:hypothetical protein BDR07DRAFT_369813 [Suillus spraguei]
MLYSARRWTPCYYSKSQRIYRLSISSNLLFLFHVLGTSTLHVSTAVVITGSILPSRTHQLDVGYLTNLRNAIMVYALQTGECNIVTSAKRASSDGEDEEGTGGGLFHLLTVASQSIPSQRTPTEIGREWRMVFPGLPT